MEEKVDERGGGGFWRWEGEEGADVWGIGGDSEEVTSKVGRVYG